MAGLSKKIFVAVLLFVCCFCTAATILFADQTGTQEYEEFRIVQRGDVDGNGKIELFDAIISMQLLVGVAPATKVYKSADINRNRGIGMAEVTYILQIAAQLREPVHTHGGTFTNSLGMSFHLIPAGAFMMGSPEDEPGRSNNETLHSVTLTEHYYMQTTEVTQGQWKAVMGNTPSYFSDCGDDCPVEQVTWNEIQAFIEKLNTLGEGVYRLPTEAEWEYAARAQTTTPFYTGDCLSTDEANYNGKYPLAGCASGENREAVVPVGTFAPNTWGLYDMHGNVWEWVQDWYGEYPSEAVTDPHGPSTGTTRVVRGGGWNSGAGLCRSAIRINYDGKIRRNYIGFRLIRVCNPEPCLDVYGEDIIKTVEHASGEVVAQRYTLMNNGQLPLDWAIEVAEDDAISLSPASGSLDFAETATVTLFIDTAKLSRGMYMNSIHFKNLSGDASNIISRQVRVEVVTFENTLAMKFNHIPAGAFMMGSAAEESERFSDETRHPVTLTRDYYLQTTEVTQGQWQTVMGNTPSYFTNCGDDCPVEQVSWDDVQTFIARLNTRGQGTYRLPTEAEWELAARAQTTTPFYTGDCLSTDEANYNGKYPLTGCASGENRETVVPVASFAPNTWGLYDMHGNVGEWVEDWYGEYSTEAVTDPHGPASGVHRIFRGGGWNDSAGRCRSAGRDDAPSDDRSNHRGFRLVWTGDCKRAPYLEVEGADIIKAVLLGSGDVIVRQYMLKNTGQLPLDWAIDFVEDDAISIFPTSGNLGTDQTATVTVSINTEALPTGTYRNTLHFKNLYDPELLSGYASGSTLRQISVNIVTEHGGTYTNSPGMSFNLIPAGSFMMGSPEDEPGRSDDETQYQVTLSKAYYMQTTEVTQGQWEAVMGSNPSWFSDCGYSCPVENVTWKDVQDFIEELNKRGQGTYRLPTEAEWEYAARAGSATAFANGDISETLDGYDPNLDDMGWYYGNSLGYYAYARIGFVTQPVAGKQPNAWGLYDMHGNVAEWVQDWYDEYPSEGVTDPTGPVCGFDRVVRGGSTYAMNCRSAYRGSFSPTTVNLYRGFRLVREGDLEVQGADIIESVLQGTGDVISRQYTLKNSGQRSLVWTVEINEDDTATISPTSGRLGKNETATVTVTIDTGKLPRGAYVNNIKFHYVYDGLVSECFSSWTSRRIRIDVTAFINSLGMSFQLIPAGAFMMGSPEDEPGRSDNETLHSVTLTEHYYMQTTEVTQGQWKAVMGSTPSYFSDCGDDCPVEQVTWSEIQAFIEKLNTLGEGVYRLPTEAEWEYAARAQTTTPFHTGNSLSREEANYFDKEWLGDGFPRFSWYIAYNRTVPVASFAPNQWGLYDMHGNVGEWVQDRYGVYPSEAAINPTGPSSGDSRVLRGGGWRSPADQCRSAHRSSSYNAQGFDNGFRVVLSQVP